MLTVAIQRHDACRTQRHRDAHAIHQAGALASVSRMAQHPGTFACGDGTGLVTRAVVHHDDARGAGRGATLADDLADRGGLIVGRDDDANPRRLVRLLLRRHRVRANPFDHLTALVSSYRSGWRGNGWLE